MDLHTFCRVDLDYYPKVLQLYGNGGVPPFKRIFTQTLPKS